MIIGSQLNNLLNFTLEVEQNGPDEDEEEAIIITDDESEDGQVKSLLSHITSISESSKINTESQNRGTKDPKSFRSLRTYELSEDDKSQINTKISKKNTEKLEKRKRNEQAFEVNMDEDSDEDEENSVSNQESPLTRFGWKKQVSTIEIAQGNQEKVKSFSKLSRRPDKYSNNQIEEDKKELTDTIEVSDFESSVNSFGTSLSSNSKINRQNISRNIEEKVRKSQNNYPLSLK